MSLKNTFCSSPWIHVKINNSGHYSYCRWSKSTSDQHISQHSPTEFFRQTMTPVRQQFLQGQMPEACWDCEHMESHGKVSGRQKQLLKIGVQLENFEKTLASSPWVQEFAKGPGTTQFPQDWQIDLGNYCNGACVFCSPAYSSKLATEQLKLGIISQLPPPNWTDDPELIQRFIETLQQSPHIQYLHFIGGEPLVIPAFEHILTELVRTGLNRTATIGFTTNLSVWKPKIAELLSQFHSVNLGMSIESFGAVNSYVRWPVDQTTVTDNIAKWTELAQQHQWLLQFRTTPTCLTVDTLISVYNYAWNHNIAVESCNFLNRPEFMRPAVLPWQYRRPIIETMTQWIKQRKVSDATVLNIRDPNQTQSQLVQDLESYVEYFQNEQDQSWRLPDLVAYLRKIESVRGNSVLDYVPQYEDLFRSAGY